MIEKMIREARSQRASDIHISEGQAVYLRIDGKLIKSDLELSDEMTRNLILSLLTKERQESIWHGEDADFALETSDGNRQRVNVFCQQDASRQQFVCLMQKCLHSRSFICRQCFKILQMSRED